MNHNPDMKHLGHYTKLPSMHARLSAIYDTYAPPSEQVMAWANYRQEEYIEKGLEGLTGGGASYHLENDVTRYLVDAVDCMHGRVDGVTYNQRCRSALRALSKAIGCRAVRGCEGIAEGLRQRRETQSTLEAFQAQRGAFLMTAFRHMDAADLMNERSENPEAVWAVIRMLRDEMRVLSEWCERAGQHTTANWIRRGLAEYEEAMSMGPLNAPPRPRNKKRRGW